MAIVTTSQILSALSYAQGEIIEIRNGAVLTVNATPTTRPGTVQCITSGKLRIENASPTTPLIFNLHDMTHDLRFEAGGVLEIRGAPMSLAAGTGAAQTWDFTSLFGGVIRHMTYVEIEESAGSGVYMPWPVIQEDPKFNIDVGAGNTIGGAAPAAFSAGNTLAGQVLFWHETNRTLRCGDNVNGRAVPSGCAVRIPNIFVSNRLLTNSSLAFNLVTTGSPTGGTFQLELRSEDNSTLIGTTAAIPFNATAAQVDTAIEAVTGVGTVTPGSGPLPGMLSVSWAGAYANIRPCVRVVGAALTGGTNPQVYVFENNNGNLSLVDLSPSGTMDAEWVSFSDKFRLVTDTFKSVRLMGVGFGGDAWQLNTSNGSVEVDGFAISRSPWTTPSVSQVSSVLGDVSLRRAVSASKVGVGFNLNVVPNLTVCDRLSGITYGTKTSTNNRMLQFITLPKGLKITNLVNVGAAANFQNLSDCKIVGFSHAETTLSTQSATANQGAALSNVVGCTFANVTDAGPSAIRNTVYTADAACSVLKFYNITGDAQGNRYGIMAPNSSDLEFANISMANLRGAAPPFDMPAAFLSNKIKLKKCFFTWASAQISAGFDACQDGEFDLVSSTIVGINEAFSGVNNFVGGNYTDPSLTPTTGHVTFGPFGAGTGLALTGAAYTDALGAFLLPMAGDTAEITMPFAMHGITGFQNVAPYLYVDAPGVAANVGFVGNPGAPNGGTFTITVADSSGTVLGTTPPLAWSASTATVQAAVRGLNAAINLTTVGGSLATGYSLTFNAGFVGVVSCDGALLTGGTDPGVAYAFGRARLQTGTELLGSITTVEFAMRVPGSTWPAYAALTGANLSSAFGALTGYAAGGTGLEMRLRVTAGQTNPYTRLNQISLPTNVDPSLWFVGDATINLLGPNPTDVTRVLRASDSTVLYSFTGSGEKSFTVGANFDVPVYFRREDSGGTILMRTLPATQRLSFGANGDVALFYGAEVQLAQASTLTTLDALIQSRLDVAVSTRLPTSSYTAPTAAPSASTVAAAVRTELSTELARIDVGVGTRASAGNLAVVNDGVQKASLLIPHTGEVA